MSEYGTNHPAVARLGASEGAVRRHYDVGNEFYALWLDSTLTYSAGLWTEGANLEQAQLRKVDLHLEWSHAASAKRLLDVGCGWASLLARVSNATRCGLAVGLTLSRAQLEYARTLHLDRVEVRLESWREHSPTEAYDSIVSIGALEHFVRPECSDADRIDIYREFFLHCRDWLRPGGYMSLQTIGYGDGAFRRGAIASIFPESDLPRLSQLAIALDGVLDVVRLSNSPQDYAKTCRAWLERLRSNMDRAAELLGRERAKHYESFLDASARGFEAGVFGLYRIQLYRR
jgi:cyclopropane-fatty-acyl-phospholipid synthase